MEVVAYFLHAAWPTLLAIASGWPLVWLATEFVLRPIRYFYDLKREAKQITLLLWDAPEHGGDPDQWEWGMAQVKGKRDRLTDIAAEFFAFGQSEHFATWFLQIAGYDPINVRRTAKRL